MALDPAYQQLHEQAQELLSELRDALGDQQGGTANGLRQAAQHLEDAIQERKSPRDVESYVVNFQKQVEACRSQGSVMTYEHADFFYDALERMRQRVRQLPDY